MSEFNWLNAIKFFRNTRRELLQQNQSLDDSIYWLIVAEAIVLASTSRLESRGYFCRMDIPSENPDFENYFTCASYNKQTDKVQVKLLDKSLFEGDLLFRK
ncbi:MAG: hypothetical protein WBA93_04710 [Microcoleaceae cyanobacterium]